MSKLRELVDELCPDGVEYQHFDEVCTLKARVGWQRLTKKEHLPSGDYMLVTGTDFTDAHSIDYSTCVYVDKARYDMDENIQLRDGDVLITKDGTLGKVAFVDGLPMPATLNGGVFVVRAMGDRLEQRFIMHFLLSHGFTAAVESQHTGSTIKHLTQAIFSKIKIPVPPIEIQREVVRILDSFQELDNTLTAEIEAREKLYCDMADGLMSGFDAVELGSVASFSYGLTAKATDIFGTRFVRITDITSDGLLSSDDKKYVDPSIVSEKYVLNFGDVVVARTGASFGKTLYYDSPDSASFASFLIKIHFCEALLPRFYWHFANSPSYWMQANQLVSNGAQPQFNANVLTRVRVPLPEIDQQVEIASKLDSVRCLIKSLRSERDARRKQFEHYRDKLLSFPEKEA